MNVKRSILESWSGVREPAVGSGRWGSAIFASWLFALGPLVLLCGQCLGVAVGAAAAAAAAVVVVVLLSICCYVVLLLCCFVVLLLLHSCFDVADVAVIVAVSVSLLVLLLYTCLCACMYICMSVKVDTVCLRIWIL